MFTLIWILFVMFILILVAISEYEIAKQDAEWMKDDALRGLNEREFIIHRINQILDSRIEGERPKIKEVKVKK